MVSSSWSVVTTAKADDSIIERFIEHYLSMGAEHIYVFLDAPKEQALQKKLNKYSVSFFECTDEFWKSRPHHHSLRHKKGEKPSLVEYRQYHNLIHALNIANTEWILNVDIDELLFSDSNVSCELSMIPREVYTALVYPYEAVYKDKPPKDSLSVFDNKYFKSRDVVDYKYWESIYKDKGLHQKSGFFGHVTGKSFVRVDEDILRGSCHLPIPMNEGLKLGYVLDKMRILHFEAMTRDAFVNKIINRAKKVYKTGFLDESAIKRIEYLVNKYNKEGVSSLDAAYREMHVFSEENINKCINDGFVINIEKLNISRKYLSTIDGKEIFYSKDDDSVKLLPAESNHNNTTPVIVNTLHGSGLACLCIIDGRSVRFLHSDRNGLLRACKTKSGQYLKVIKEKDGVFHLSCEMTMADSKEPKNLSLNDNGNMGFFETDNIKSIKINPF